jgi:anti-sigma B factor antagonist
MRHLNVDTEFVGIDGVVLHVTGELDVATSELLEAALRALQMDGWPNIVLDLSGLSFIDSTGLNVLVGAHRRAKARGGSVVIRGASHSAIRLLQLTALDRQLMIEAPATVVV